MKVRNTLEALLSFLGGWDSVPRDPKGMGFELGEDGNLLTETGCTVSLHNFESQNFKLAALRRRRWHADRCLVQR